jgi:hypothetical protein
LWEFFHCVFNPVKAIKSKQFAVTQPDIHLKAAKAKEAKDRQAVFDCGLGVWLRI